MERRPFVVLLLALAALVAGCSGGEAGGDDGRAGRLEAAARSLLPAGARVVAQGSGDCYQLEPAPSCVTLYFVVPRPLDRRIALVKRTAGGGGWLTVHTDAGPGGTGLAFQRPGFEADVALWRSPRNSCGRLDLADCTSYVDHVQVDRRS